MLEDLGIRFEGQAASWLAQRAAEAADGLIDALIMGACLVWQSRGFQRFSDNEICCTVPFFDCCECVVESEPETFSILRIVYDAVQPDRAMLAGLADPKRAARPDLSAVFGPVTIRIEAKKLALGDGLPRKYVREGMKRFISGKYTSSPGRSGFMLGYVVHDETKAIITKINEVIVAEDDLSEADELKSMTEPIPILCRCESNHSNGVRLIHSAIDVRKT